MDIFKISEKKFMILIFLSFKENLVIVARADCAKNVNLCKRFGTTTALRFIPIVDGKIQKSEVSSV